MEGVSLAERSSKMFYFQAGHAHSGADLDLAAIALGAESRRGAGGLTKVSLLETLDSSGFISKFYHFTHTFFCHLIIISVFFTSDVFSY